MLFNRRIKLWGTYNRGLNKMEDPIFNTKKDGVAAVTITGEKGYGMVGVLHLLVKYQLSGKVRK